MILSALGDGFLSLAIFIVLRNFLVLAAGRLSRASEHKIHAALHGKISPHQTDQAMCAMASDMAFKVALVIKNLALIFGFEAEFWTIKFGLIFW
ncbi:hypothetical protein [uncultured Campylobacter sp.]|uniref:hypothetical protein n=1 Tax=uncultured Campylobacter sp. TaxID=218934 RepID=UPI003211A344